MKKAILLLVVIGIVGVGAYFLGKNVSRDKNGGEPVATTDTAVPDENTMQKEEEVPQPEGAEVAIGKSVEGRDIMAYNYGSGDKRILFVGGIHGGYEWNTSLVAYELMDYLKANPSIVPANVMVTVIPVLNPDGLYKVVGTAGRFVKADVPSSQNATIPGRFNAHNVDLNRNFDCDWQAKGTWQNTSVSGGSAAFSEPESAAIKAYMETHPLQAVVVWYSAAGGVFSSNCHNGVLSETADLTALYAEASGYKAYKSFDFYKITGDMVNWFAKNNVPAISVLLSTHNSTEWDKNQKGVQAILKHYTEK